MNLKNILLGIGIVIVFGLLLWQGIESFYPSPDYEDFCPSGRNTEIVETQTRCEELGGMWNLYGSPKPIDGPNGYCDLDYTCRQEWEDAQGPYYQIVFIISLIIGVIAILVGYFILSIEPVGSALIASGIWALFWGAIRNWQNFTAVWRFILLAIVLVLLIWLALRAARKNDFSTKKKE